MHRSKQSLTTWFHAAYLVATLTPGISSLQFQRQLGIKRVETAWNLLHKLRSALVAPDREPLHGEVQVDEGYVGGVEEGRPGRGAERKALVIFGVEVIHFDKPVRNRKTGEIVIQKRTRGGRIRAAVIPNASKKTLHAWIEKNVKPGSVVVTDGLAAYEGIEKKGYLHAPILQSRKGVATGQWLPLIHLIVSNLKRWIIGTHKGAVRTKHLQAYLNEFAFRFNRRFWRGPAFLRVLGFMVSAECWPEYETLYHAGEVKGWKHPDGKAAPRNVTDAMKWIREKVEAEGNVKLLGWMDKYPDVVKKAVRDALLEAGAGRCDEHAGSQPVIG